MSPRESEVLRLAALGSTSEEIAGDLTITRATIRKHFENIYRKLGVQIAGGCGGDGMGGRRTTTILDESGPPPT